LPHKTAATLNKTETKNISTEIFPLQSNFARKYQYYEQSWERATEGIISRERNREKKMAVKHITLALQLQYT
jgi:hypothetical protein